jgi:hypothetical protein
MRRNTPKGIIAKLRVAFRGRQLKHLTEIFDIFGIPYGNWICRHSGKIAVDPNPHDDWANVGELD